MLYHESPANTFTPWAGAVIAGVKHPLDIEQSMTAGALADIGLFKPVEPAVPEGKYVVSKTVSRVGGVVTYVYELEDIPQPVPSPYLAGIANITIANGEIGGVETAAFLQAAIWMGPGLYWVFFAEPMSDLNFIATASASVGLANVTARALDYIEISVTADDGSPLDPAEVSLQIFKVQ
jgi:hypothetical protein